MAELIEARHGGYLDRLLMSRNFGVQMNTTRAVIEASKALQRQRAGLDEKVAKRSESGGRTPSYAPPVNLKNDLPEKPFVPAGLDLDALRGRALDDEYGTHGMARNRCR
jgi:hypothetical protein